MTMRRRTGILLAAVMAIAGLVWLGLRLSSRSDEARIEGPPAAGSAVEREERARRRDPSAPPTPAEAESTAIDESDLPPSEAKAPGVFLVRVEHHDGTPAGEVEVRLLSTGTGETIVRTDAEGEAKLHPSARPVILLARAPGLRPIAHRSWDDGGTTIVLPRSETVRGRLLVEGKAPGRPITFELAPALETLDEVARDIATGISSVALQMRIEADAEGSFRIEGLALPWRGRVVMPRGLWLMSVDGATESSELRLAVRHLDEPVRLDCFAQPTVSGRCRIGDRFAAGLSVGLRRAGERRTIALDRSSPEGSFTLCLAEWTPDVDLELEVADADGKLLLTHRFRMREANTDLGEIEVPGQFGGSIRVMDESGSPIAGAIAEVSGQMGGPTDASGEIRLAQLVPRGATAAVSAPGRTTVLLPAPGADEVASVTLAAARTLRVVLTENGRPAAGREVRVWERRSDPNRAAGLSSEAHRLVQGLLHVRRTPEGESFRIAVTDREGVAVVGDVAPGNDAWVDVRGHGHLTLFQARVPDGGGPTVEVAGELVAVTRLSLRVVAEDGRPLSGARVHVSLAPARNGAPVGTDADGRAAVDLPAGSTVWLDALAPGHSRLSCEPRALDGEEWTLTLRAAPRIEVTIAEHDGRPSDANLTVSGQALPLVATRARRDGPGRFRIVDAPDGPFTVLAIAGLRTYERRIDPALDGERVVITLPERHELRVDLKGDLTGMQWPSIFVLRDGRVLGSLRPENPATSIEAGTYEVYLAEASRWDQPIEGTRREIRVDGATRVTLEF
ncbi:MAG: hypothetical protein R3F20_06240 [Planctomycetota bacterium]